MITKKLKFFILISFFLFLVTVTLSILTFEKVYDLNFHTSINRQKKQILGFFTLKTTYEVNYQIKNFFTENELTQMPDKWELITVSFRNIQGKKRSKDDVGMTVLKIINIVNSNFNLLDDKDIQKFRSVLIKYISLISEDNKRSYGIVKLYMIISNKVSGKEQDFHEELQRLDMLIP